MAKRYLSYIIIILTVSLSSCVTDGWEEDMTPSPHAARGVINIEVLTPGAETDDQIRKARFIIFDNASTNPKIDVNEAVSFGIPYRNAKSFRATLEVNQNDDKMVIVVINEQNEHKAALDGVVFPADLEKLMYDGRVTGNDPIALNVPPVTGLPMSGVKRGISVTAANATLETAAQVSMTVERSLARVEVWMRSEPGITVSTRAGTSPTQAHLYRSASVGYLVAGTEADGTRFQTGAAGENNFGLMLDVANPQQAFLWSCFPYEVREIGTTAEMLVAFYIPERMCDAADNANKLMLDILNVVTSTGDRKVENIVLSEFIPNGGTQPEPLTMIRRNNIYRLTGAVKADGIEFTCIVTPWDEENVSLMTDQTDYLKISNNRYSLPDNGNTAVANVRTSVSAGIVIGDTKYFDKDGNDVTGSGGGLAGWLTCFPGKGSTGLLNADLTLTVTGDIPAADKGCYAELAVSAELLSGKVTVTR